MDRNRTNTNNEGDSERLLNDSPYQFLSRQQTNTTSINKRMGSPLGTNPKWSGVLLPLKLPI